MNIAETLKFFRQKKNLSQSEAKPKDMSQPAYSSIERGDRSITMKELQEYLDNTSISPNEFFLFQISTRNKMSSKKFLYPFS
ncbi:helix-turn-helix domain-containing protein [Enterococcus termitis]